MRRNAIISLIPFSIFVISAIGISIVGTVDINLLVSIGILAILICALLTKGKDWYWSTIFELFGSKTAVTATLLWLIVGVYGAILKEGHLVEGLVWAAERLQIGSTIFTVAVFLFSGLFAISTGSGFGTISAMSITLFPAGIVLGANPALLGGAILSGAALGDSIAPVSDTAVIAASTQECADDRQVADIGGTVYSVDGGCSLVGADCPQWMYGLYHWETEQSYHPLEEGRRTDHILLGIAGRDSYRRS